MARYVAIIEFADGMYGAYFPDAPGCTAMGETEDEVVANASEALSEWVSDEIADGRSAPTPRTYRELRDDPEIELGKGGMLATIPLVLETGRAVRANISLDKGLLNSIDEAANHQGITRSAFLAAAARERIKTVA